MRFQVFLLALLILGCSSNKQSQHLVTDSSKPKVENQKDSLRYQPLYKATTELAWDLIHSNLVVSFDFKNETVLGEAILKLSPHFYAKKGISIDAKAVDIKEVTILNDSSNSVKYTYTGTKLNCTFSKTFSKEDTLELFINYIAQPNLVAQKTDKAIRGGKGLYFINAQGKIPNKPTQIWTQGETDYSSCWFPTLDEPNQKMSQEIVITVPDSFKTLSNGTLEFSTENGNGTRTDYWVQHLPHSPYLAMMAIGNFSVYEDSWRDKEVLYYTESNYANDAPYIFGATPKMLEFYSNKLGVDYPWDKYAQVVVRDFVSGAMENTSATLHGEFVQRHKRELIDFPQEGIIAHELFHQWFGDLVSCESWSNIALNEAFATYGEYLWVEHSKSKFESQLNLLNKQRSYFREAERKKVNLVRFQYDGKLEVFDSHSYSKGACILHQLRTVLGDDAFFTGLQLYLNRYAHQAAEMHQLRLVMEEVTGKDLNWFFNQWMFDNGHPELEITYHYDARKTQNFMVMRQTQDLNEYPLYQIPLVVNTHYSNATLSDSIWIENELDTFYLNGKQQADFIDYDSQDYLLAEVVESNRNANSWYAQFSKSTSYIDLQSALEQLVAMFPTNELTVKAIKLGLEHSFYAIRIQAIKAMVSNNTIDSNFQKKYLQKAYSNDPSSSVRAIAATEYRKNYDLVGQDKFYKIMSADSSYLVLFSVLNSGIEKGDSSQVLQFCKQFEDEPNQELLLAISKAYMRFGSENHIAFFRANLNKIDPYKKSRFLMNYTDYLLKVNRTDYLLEGYGAVQNEFYNASSSWVKSTAVSCMLNFYKLAKKEVKYLQNEIESTNKDKLEEAQMRLDAIDASIVQIIDKEQDEEIIKRLEKR